MLSDVLCLLPACKQRVMSGTTESGLLRPVEAITHHLARAGKDLPPACSHALVHDLSQKLAQDLGLGQS